MQRRLLILTQLSLGDSTEQKPVLVQRVQSVGFQKAKINLCYRCGGSHWAYECKFKEAQCYMCKQRGHIAKACRSSGKKPPDRNQGKSRRQTHFVEEQQTNSPPRESYTLFTLRSKGSKPIRVSVLVNKQKIDMEVDTGAARTIISEHTFNEIRKMGKLELKTSDVILNSYSGHEIKVLGTCDVEVVYQDVQKPLTILLELKLNWREIQQIQATEVSSLQSVLLKYNELFDSELGTLKGETAKIHVDPQAKPVFCRARPVPYAQRNKVEQELERLEKMGRVEKVQFSEWASPIVPVMKQDGTIRICGDYNH